MAKRPRKTRSRSDSYWQATRRPLSSLLFVLPLLVFFQLGATLHGTGLLAPRDIGRFLRYFGVTAAFLPPLVIVVVLLVQHFLQSDKREFHPKILAGMVGESILWTVPLIVINHMTGRLVFQGATSGPAGEAIYEQVLIAVGAGIYEEFIFRLALIAVVMMFFVDVCGLDKHLVAAGAVVAAAVLFSLYHLTADQIAGDLPFPWYDFVFRLLAGAYLGWVYLFRGFGVAVGAHIVFNVYVVMYGA